MPQKNLVSLSIADADMEKIKAAVKTLNEVLLPNLKTLKPDDRHELPKMGDKTVAFVKKSLEYSGSNPDIAPQFLDVKEFKIDVDAVETVRALFQPISQIADVLNDTMLLAGSEAYAGALMYYNAAKNAAKSNIPGAKVIYNDLSSRFPGRPKAVAAAVSAASK